MFKEKIRELFQLLQITSTDLARFAGCDKSYISRMASGAKIPKRGGKGVRRMVNGLYLCADEKGLVGPLCDWIRCPERSAAADVKAHLTAWLYEGEESVPPAGGASAEKVPYRVFGEKLNALMELTGLSNIRLGRSVNLDPSYISRFRNGFRSPKANPKIMGDICGQLLDRVREQEKTAALARMIGLPPEELERSDSAFERLYGWLFSSEQADNIPLVEGLIDQIGSFSADIQPPPFSLEEASEKEILSETVSIYHGTAGLRRAVIRFLGNVILRGEKELWLYSDQNMDWMVSDPLFRAKWASLMILCVTGGVRIRIIHNVDRDLAEMADAIKSWLPLYPSGMIESYYCKVNRGERFSATRFLCPGYACISGCNVRGAEDKTGLYRYDADPELLEVHQNAYGELLARSGKLVQVYQTENVGGFGETDTGSLAVFSNTLSLATMPEEILSTALERAKADETVRERILAVQKSRAAVLERALRSGFLHEYCPLATDEDLFAGKTPMDVPELSLTYTPREYADHIRRVISLSDENTRYRLFIIPEAPFEDLKILISDRSVAVVRLKPPFLTIRFGHPDLCRAFVAYAERIRDQYKQDKLTTREILERYL